MTRTSKNILNSRDTLSKNITHTWSIIMAENLVDKGVKRNYDMKELLGHINAMAKARIIDKLDSLCINMGIKDRKDFPKDSIYPIIFAVSEKTEMFAKLSMIDTINPKEKLKKGKKGLNKTEELSAQYIASLRNKLQLEINALKKKLADYNDAETTTLIVDTEWKL